MPRECLSLPVPTDRSCRASRVFPLVGFLRFVGDADFREAVAQSVTREAQQARGLALVAIGAAQGLLNHLIFPLLQSHALRKKSAGAICRFRGAHVQMDVGWVEHASFRTGAGALDNVLQPAA